MSNPVPRFRRRNGSGKNPDGQGVKVEIFCGAKNTTRPLTVWIGGTDIDRGLFVTKRYAIPVTIKSGLEGIKSWILKCLRKLLKRYR